MFFLYYIDVQVNILAIDIFINQLLSLFLFFISCACRAIIHWRIRYKQVSYMQTTLLVLTIANLVALINNVIVTVVVSKVVACCARPSSNPAPAAFPTNTATCSVCTKLRKLNFPLIFLMSKFLAATHLD